MRELNTSFQFMKPEKDTEIFVFWGRKWKKS